MDDSDSSSLSSAPATEDERLAPIFKMARGKKAAPKRKKAPVRLATPPTPPPPARSPSPPHEESLADNPDIAFIVIFRSRFSSAFPPKLPNYGPQDIEAGVTENPPSPQVEDLMCALLALVLNRKKPVERGHHSRAMEEALSTQKHQWPLSWNRVNPLAGSRTFTDMTPTERLNLLRTLIIWSLTSSDVISQTIKDSYKGTRKEDDQTQPLSVQPWGWDADKRSYWLIEGQEDTTFRVYREANRYTQNPQWWSIAGTIEEVKALAETLRVKHDTQPARRLAVKIDAAVPRFEMSEEKRRRREYRQIRKAQFTRPEPGFSLYEGRTRGKRIRYTFDDNDEDSDATGSRRSNRYSGHSTPADNGPVVTASGRQSRPARSGTYGESLLSGQADTPDYAASETSGRATRASRRMSPLNESRKRKSNGYDSEGMSDGDQVSSGNEWDGGEDEDENDDDDVDMADAEDDDDDTNLEPEEKRSLVVKLKFRENIKVPASDTTTMEEKPPPIEPSEQPPPQQISLPQPEPPLKQQSTEPAEALQKLEPEETPLKPAQGLEKPPVSVADKDMTKDEHPLPIEPSQTFVHAHPPQMTTETNGHN